MKKILVTGGAGFIGSHLCERLLGSDNEVICLDNFFTGTKENIIHLMDHPYFELIRHDITMPFYIEVDEIYHLACPASPIHYQYNPIKTVKTSVMGTINMLGLAKRIRAKLLLASTSEVYGDPTVHPQIPKPPMTGIKIDNKAATPSLSLLNAPATNKEVRRILPPKPIIIDLMLYSDKCATGIFSPVTFIIKLGACSFCHSIIFDSRF